MGPQPAPLRPALRQSEGEGHLCESRSRSTEWWHGVFAGEDTLDAQAVSVTDYVRAEQLPAEQRAEMQAAAAQCDAEVDRHSRAKAAEAALPAAERRSLHELRAAFPDIPIEYGDSQASF